KRKDSLNSFKRVCKKTGINGVTFHTLRHTFGTRALEASGNIVTVNKILGHRSLQTTMRYVHIDKALYETVEKINKAK
ncbi:MAG: tyrosine-type recombinase/integrase, partial [Candidatus Dadabacteria bacterium]|nr:tyrosine-type recombinase/integrase [Candidatus Dadabacteria bacterium]